MEYIALAVLAVAFIWWGMWNRKDERRDVEHDIGEREYQRGFTAGAQYQLIEVERLRRLDAAAAAARQPFILAPPRAEHIEVDDDHEIVVRKKPQNKRKAARTP